MPPDIDAFRAMNQEVREKLPQGVTLRKVVCFTGGLLMMGTGGLAISAGLIMLISHGMVVEGLVTGFLGTCVSMAGWPVYRLGQWQHWQPHRGSKLETLEKFNHHA